jgi:transcriptional regulator, AraC family
MGTDKIQAINVESIKQVSNGSAIDNDLVLLDEIAQVPLPHIPKTMKCLFLALCRKGKVEYSVNTIKNEVCANDIIIISSGQLVNDYKLSDDCSGIAIAISDSFFRDIISGVHELSYLFTFSRTHPVFHLTEQEAQNIVDYFHLIKLKVDETSHRFRRDTARSLIQALIYDTGDTIWRLQQNGESSSTRAEKIFMGFMSLLEHHYRKERRVGWYALQLNITPKYLSETIRQVSHQTPNSWIDNYVVMQLRIMLKNTTKSIKEITEELHFPNQSFLGKYFKQHVGMSPSAYRKSLNETR